MDIAVCINKKFLQHFHAMLTSVCLNSSIQNFNVHIIHSDLSFEDQNLIKNNFSDKGKLNFYFYEINKNLFKGIEILSEHLSIESLYRLDLPNLLPKEIKKIVYLDADLIVLSDIKELYNVDLSNSYLAACNEYFPFLSQNLDLESDLDYFNAGVLVINLDKWRKDNFTQICLDFAKTTNKKLYCLDQDILNGVLKGNWTRLGIEWNVVKTLFFETERYFEKFEKEKILSAIKNPKIVHYTDFSKPWYYLDDHPMKNLYEYYLDKSNFKYVKNLDELVLKNSDIYIFGASQGGLNVFSKLSHKIEFKGFIDNSREKIGKEINGKSIFSPFKFKGKEIIIIGSKYIEEISKQLEELGYTRKLTYFTSIREFYINVYNNKEKLSKQLDIQY